MCCARYSGKRENEWHGAKVSYSKASSRQYNIAGRASVDESECCLVKVKTREPWTQEYYKGRI